MKDENAPKSEGIEPTFFRKPTSRQEGKKLHLECEIEALPKPEIFWFLGDQPITDSDKYSLFRTIQPSNPNIHFVRLTINVSFLQANYETTSSFTYLLQEPSQADGGNYIVKAVNSIGEKECTLALNFGGGCDNEDNVPARIYEQPLLLQPDPATLILEAHIHANPKPKVGQTLIPVGLAKDQKFNIMFCFQITWLCNGDFVKESDRKQSSLINMEGEKNKWIARMKILVSLLFYPVYEGWQYRDSYHSSLLFIYQIDY